ncbi:MAG: hypothetical protein AB1847_19225 [bacterium]
MFQRKVCLYRLSILFLACLFTMTYFTGLSHAQYTWGNYPAAGYTLSPFLNNLANPYALGVPFTQFGGTQLSPSYFYYGPAVSSPFRGAAAAGPYFINALLPADVIGSWSGTWTDSTGLATGDMSLTLAQALSGISGTLALTIGGLARYGCAVSGVIDVDTLSISGTGLISSKLLLPYTITMDASVAGTAMTGTFTVTDRLLGTILQTGTFTANKL